MDQKDRVGSLTAPFPPKKEFQAKVKKETSNVTIDSDLEVFEDSRYESSNDERYVYQNSHPSTPLEI